MRSIATLVCILLLAIVCAPSSRAEFGEYTLATTVNGSVPYPVALVTGDIDQNGRDDLVLRQEDGVVTIFHNTTGIGRPIYVDTLSTSAAPRGLGRPVLADVTGDGLLDLITAGTASPWVHVYEGLGDFTFERHELYIGFENGRVRSLAVVDLTGDGLTDIVTGGNSGLIVVFEQQPDGSVHHNPLVLHPEQPVVKALLPVDIESDGDMDLLVAWNDPGELTLFRNGPDGLTEEPFSPAAYIHDLALADLDGDGDDDIVATGYGRLLAYVNQGGSYDTVQLANSPANALTLDVGDVEGDGDLDLVTVIQGLDRLIVWENLGGLLFGQSPVELSAPGIIRDARFTDADNDGDLDLAVLKDSWNGDLQIYTYGTAEEWVVHPTQQTDFWIKGRYPCDLDGNGTLDVLCSTSTSGIDHDPILSLLNDGDGGWSQFAFTIPNAESLKQVMDANQDGMADLVIYDYASNQHIIRIQQPGFEFSEIVPIVQAEPNQSWGGVVADFTGDGVDDVIEYDNEADSLRMISSHGSDSFEIRGIASSAEFPFQMRVGDLNGDGWLDVVFRNLQAGDPWLWFENGGLGFEGWIEHAVEMPAMISDAADIDNNGRDELLAMRIIQPGQSELGWFSYEPQEVSFVWHGIDMHSTSNNRDSAWLDANGDGLMDIVAHYYDDDEHVMVTYLYRTRPDGTYEVSIVPRDGNVGNQLIANDYDNDNDRDLLFFDGQFGEYSLFAWVENRALNGPASAMSITLTPFLQQPILVPPMGDILYFDVMIANTGDTIWSGDAWSDVVLPNGSTVAHQAATLTVTPGQEIQRSYLPLTVPGYAPSGTYTVRGSLGQQGGEVIDQDVFTFTKLSAAAWAARDDGEDATTTVSGSAVLPDAFALDMPYPNPFNAETTISIALPERAAVVVTVHNTLGQRVATLANGPLPAGRHRLALDGRGLASGVYLVHAHVPSQFNATRKLVLVK